MPAPLGLHFHRWSDRKVEQKDLSNSASFSCYVRFWSCNKKFFHFQVFYSWVYKSIFFLQAVGCFKYFKDLYFCILSFTTENYPTCLTRYDTTKRWVMAQIWERAVEIWKGHHITNQEETKTVVSLLGFWGLKWQQFKFRLTCK